MRWDLPWDQSAISPRIGWDFMGSHGIGGNYGSPNQPEGSRRESCRVPDALWRVVQSGIWIPQRPILGDPRSARIASSKPPAGNPSACRTSACEVHLRSRASCETEVWWGRVPLRTRALEAASGSSTETYLHLRRRSLLCVLL